ncbi:MAG: response regulator [Pirellulaceae bacterium]|nr:response regulator [Pirellulaceae bacterium]
MTISALVVEDDLSIIPRIEDCLFSLGHECTCVTNQSDARNALSSKAFDYVLLDLQIPAKPHRGGADKQFGMNLLEEISQGRHRHSPPVIIMTAFLADGLNLSRKLSELGAADFIAKPFHEQVGTLAKVIFRVLSQRGGGDTSAVRTNGQTTETDATADPPVEPTTTISSTTDTLKSQDGILSGGQLELFDDRAELCGVKIISDRGGGQALSILRVLTARESVGRYVRLSGEELVDQVGAADIGVITGCIKTLRSNLQKRLLKHRSISVIGSEVIVNDEQGYYLSEWVQSVSPANEIFDCRSPAVEVGPTKARSQWNQRQQWIIERLRIVGRLKRTAIDQEFHVHLRTVKRDLSELTREGVIVFVGEILDGYYQLA